jgi:hypothetical protein
MLLYCSNATLKPKNNTEEGIIYIKLRMRKKNRKKGNFKKTAGNELITFKAEDQENMTEPNGRRDIDLKVMSIKMDLALCGVIRAFRYSIGLNYRERRRIFCKIRPSLIL